MDYTGDDPPFCQPVVVLGVADLMGIEMVDITKAYTLCVPDSQSFQFVLYYRPNSDNLDIRFYACIYFYEYPSETQCPYYNNPIAFIDPTLIDGYMFSPYPPRSV